MEYCNEVWYIYTRAGAIIFIISIYSPNAQNHLMEYVLPYLHFTDDEIRHCGAK